MTGRDLIIYILVNNLENKSIFESGKIIGYMTVNEAAVKNNVGTATIYAWIKQGRLNCVVIGGVVYIPANFNLPHTDIFN